MNKILVAVVASTLLFTGLAHAETIFADNFRAKPATDNWFRTIEPGLYRPLEWHASNHKRPVWLSKFMSATHNGMLRSDGPFWLDPNHVAPGTGWLQMIAVSYWKGHINQIKERNLDNWPDGRIPDSAFALGFPDRPIDLAGITVNVRVRGDISKAPAGSWLGFYFAADSVDAIENRPIRVHYANVANPIPLHPSEWTNVEFELRAVDSDWVCLGNSLPARRTFGCAKSILDVIGSVNVNAGFLLFNGHTRPDGPVDAWVEFDRIKIQRKNPDD